MIQNINQKSRYIDSFREIKYYEYIRDHIIKPFVCPNFVMMYTYFICNDNNINFSKINMIKKIGTSIDYINQYNRRLYDSTIFIGGSKKKSDISSDSPTALYKNQNLAKNTLSLPKKVPILEFNSDTNLSFNKFSSYSTINSKKIYSSPSKNKLKNIKNKTVKPYKHKLKNILSSESNISIIKPNSKPLNQFKNISLLEKPFNKPESKPFNKPESKPFNKPESKPFNNKPESKPFNNKPKSKPFNKPESKSFNKPNKKKDSSESNSESESESDKKKKEKINRNV